MMIPLYKTKKVKKEVRGFTLIETLVAITIMLIALAGPLTIAAKGLNTAHYARDQITAFYLAQEGIEYLRNIRDEEALYYETNAGNPSFPDGIASDGGAGSIVGFGEKFTIDATKPPLSGGRTINPAAIVACPPGGCPPLLLTTSGEISTYGYNAGSPETQFTRDITIDQDDFNPDEYKITVKVTWKSPLPNHSFTLVSDVTRWHE